MPSQTTQQKRMPFISHRSILWHVRWLAGRWTTFLATPEQAKIKKAIIPGWGTLTTSLQHINSISNSHMLYRLYCDATCSSQDLLSPCSHRHLYSQRFYKKMVTRSCMFRNAGVFRIHARVRNIPGTCSYAEVHNVGARV